MYTKAEIKKARECHVDCETFSRTDLIKKGAYNYSTDPSTGAHIWSYAYDDGPVVRWLPGEPYPFTGFRGHFYAWNAQFERLIWRHVMARLFGWPRMPLERFRCVAAISRAAALPGKLANAGRCMRVTNQKDRRGDELIKLLCVPQADGEFHHPQDLLEELYDYCDQDVRTERDLEAELRPLTDYEWDCYYQYERINDRGVEADLDFARVAVTYADEEKYCLGKRLEELTQGQVKTPRQFQKIKDWVWPHLSLQAQKACEHYVDGEKKISFDKAVRHNLLDAVKTTQGLNEPYMSPEAVEFVEIIDLAGNSSVSKFQTMLDVAHEGRVKGLYIYSGAGQTGRASSIKLQLHNLRRDVIDDFEHTRDAFVDGAEMGDIIPTLAGMIRPSLRAKEKHKLVWGDWSAIEARALPWLSQDPQAEAKLDLFRDGVDVYKLNAKSMGFDPEKGRQTGKVAELSLGYGGGIGAFQSMARGYNVRVKDALADQIKKRWRNDNRWAVAFWHELERAAMSAMHKPLQTFEAGRVSYLCMPGIMNGLGALWCTLPSGRMICYPNARLEMVETPWGGEKQGITAIKGNWFPKKDEKQWPRVTLWYGLLAENVTQATCVDILNTALLKCQAAMLPVIMHTHDEIVLETRKVKGHAGDLKYIMENPDDIFEGLPLNADVEYGARYKIAA